jgi:hypothetical protein
MKLAHSELPAMVALTLLGSLAFVHLGAIPVFEDEGTQMRWIWQALQSDSWLQPLLVGKPLEAWLPLPFVWFGLPALWVMRPLHVLAGVATTLLSYRVARAMAPRAPALAAGALYALCPFVVYLQRFALPDGTLAFGSMWVLWCALRFIDTPLPRCAAWLAVALVVAALSKLPVGFVCALDVPLALLLMPPARRQPLLRGAAGRLLLAAHTPVAVLAAAVCVTALIRARHGQIPGFGLQDLLGIGLGGYDSISAAMKLPRPTLFGELSVQLTPTVVLIGVVGLIAGACWGDWRQRWLLLAGAVPMLAIGLLSTFWYSRYLLFTLAPLDVVAVLGWYQMAQRAGRWRGWVQLPPLLLVAAVMGSQSGQLIESPADARWSAVDRFQYFEGWGSGYGYPEAARFLLAASPAPALVYALDGHSACQLASYLPRAWQRRVRSISDGPHGEPLTSTEARRANLALADPAWLIVPRPLLQHYLDASFGQVDPVDSRLLAQFRKPGERVSLGIYTVAVQEVSHE